MEKAGQYWVQDGLGLAPAGPGRALSLRRNQAERLLSLGMRRFDHERCG